MANCRARVLFILKYREVMNKQTGEGISKEGLSSGLLNSAKFVHDMLAGMHVETDLVQVMDNNDIDREVSKYKPTHVIIEAFWVVPEKFDILQRLHPDVTWVVRSHSEVPFLANEGVAFDWIIRYMDHKNVIVASNSIDTTRDLRGVIAATHPNADVTKKIIYLPNFYPYKFHRLHAKKENGYLDVCCFGAIRPLKNTLIQAVAALEFSRMVGKRLRFHVNGDRAEQGGDNNMRNLRALFGRTKDAELVEVPWMPHGDFLDYLAKMDIGMQVTFTETFNIVSADMVVCQLPIVVSKEIIWAHKWCQADCTSADDIITKLVKVTDWRFKNVTKLLNLKNLRAYAEESRQIWMQYFSDPQ